MITTIVKANCYMDSIFLMKASKEVMAVEGVHNAVVVMGSEMNKTVLKDFGGLTPQAQAAGPNDLIISVEAGDAVIAENAEARVAELMTQKEGGSGAGEAQACTSLPQAIEETPGANLVMISLPGEYAAMEAKLALRKGMHAFIFSDLPLEDELELKKLGADKGLLVMGPGAGTAVIDGVSIGLMSKVRRGRIGIAAASGSGLQEVAVLVHRRGEGISQAIGVGGHDLTEKIAGSMMLRSIEILNKDPDTKVIALVSKPPHSATARLIYDALAKVEKPKVVFFLGGNAEEIKAVGAYAPATLEDAADMAVALARDERVDGRDTVRAAMEALKPIAALERAKLSPGQQYLRGLFCGGTHSEEAVTLMQAFVPRMHSNIAFGKVDFLTDRTVSLENTLIDMGDEEFTRGKPHPVIDPAILVDRLMQEGRDAQVAAILFDIVLGYGAHDDPAGCIEDALTNIWREAQNEGRHICMIASVCGTDMDPQIYDAQVSRLERIGVRVMGSNARAALLAGMIAAGEEPV